MWDYYVRSYSLPTQWKHFKIKTTWESRLKNVYTKKVDLYKLWVKCKERILQKLQLRMLECIREINLQKYKSYQRKGVNVEYKCNQTTKITFTTFFVSHKVLTGIGHTSTVDNHSISEECLEFMHKISPHMSQ